MAVFKKKTTLEIHQDNVVKKVEYKESFYSLKRLFFETIIAII
jgi:hypothetical protein